MVGCHESSLIKQGGDWTLIESAEVTRARSALAAETRFVSALLDATSALVLTVDSDGRIIRCNAACEAIAGKPRSEIEGRYVWDIVALRKQGVLDVLGECWSVGGTRKFESKLPLAEGGEMIVEWSTAGVYDGDGGLSCLVATGQDITDHRLAERKLREAYDLEHHVAQTLQESLLRPAPQIPGLQLGLAYRPANEAERVGGDFYDVFQTSPTKVITVVGDVSGKGVKAAGLTETVRSTLRALLYMDLSPEEALTRAGAVLYDQTLPEQFATVGIAVLDLGGNEVRYASAGHPPPVLLGDVARFADVPQGVPLGACLHEYEHTTLTLRPSECLVMYTDGLGDARSGGEFFWDALLGVVEAQGREPEQIVSGLLDAAESFSRTALADDIAIVALRLPA